jgi:hypothetical protein
MVAIRAIGIGTAAWLAACLPSNAQQVVDLYGVTEATLQWSAASGQVSGYYVIVARNGGTPAVYGVSVDTRETVKAPLGETVTVQVAAFDAGGIAGPVSAPSDTIRFNRTAGGGTTTPPPPPPPAEPDPDPTPPPDTNPVPPPDDGSGGVASAVRLDTPGTDTRTSRCATRDGTLTLWAMRARRVARPRSPTPIPDRRGFGRFRRRRPVTSPGATTTRVS